MFLRYSFLIFFGHMIPHAVSTIMYIGRHVCVYRHTHGRTQTDRHTTLLDPYSRLALLAQSKERISTNLGGCDLVVPGSDLKHIDDSNEFNGAGCRVDSPHSFHWVGCLLSLPQLVGFLMISGFGKSELLPRSLTVRPSKSNPQTIIFSGASC